MPNPPTPDPSTRDPSAPEAAGAEPSSRAPEHTRPHAEGAADSPQPQASDRDRDRQHWQRAMLCFRSLLQQPTQPQPADIEALNEDAEVKQHLLQLLRAEAADPQDRLAVQIGDWIEQLGSAEASAAAGAGSASLLGRRIGAWTLDAELGSGGMSRVFLARRSDVDFEQAGALKLLSLPMLATGGARRFVREQQLLARMRHPNIAMLLDGGLAEDGTPFLVTELVQGEHIDDYCLKHDLQPRAVVQLLLQLCEAISHAHARLVLHRDIKPSNVMVTAEGQIKLLDFGISKLADEAAEGTQTRAFTPKYAAPEQLDGSAVTTATDVFGLGTLASGLLQGISAPAPELARIVSMATRPEPARRYASVDRFAADLRNWLQDRPIEAVPDAFAYRARKFLQRNRLPVLAASGFAALLLLGLSVTLWQAAQIREQLAISERTADFLVQLFAEADPLVAQGSPTTARELLARAQRSLPGITEPAVHDRLVIAVARAYESMADYRDAHQLLTSDLQVPLSQQSADTRLLAARAAFGAGLTAPAIALLRETPTQGEHAHRVHSTLGQYLSSDTRFAEADAEFSAAERALGEDGSDAERADLQLAIARNHIRQARYAEALATLEQASTLAQAATLPLQSASSEQLRAQIANIEGRSEDALRHAQAAGEHYQRIYSPEHSAMIALTLERANALTALGRHAEAVAALEPIAETARRRMGDSTTTTDVLNFLSLAYRGAGRLEDAIATGLETSETLVRMGDGEHMIRANVLGNVAGYQIELGELQAAEPNIETALRILTSPQAQGHPLAVFVEYQREKLALRRGRAAQAAPRLAELALRARETTGPSSGLTLPILASAGRAFLRSAAPEQAVELFEQRRAALQARGESSEIYVGACLDLAEALLAAGNAEQARTLFEANRSVVGEPGPALAFGLALRSAQFALADADRLAAQQALSPAYELLAANPRLGAEWSEELAALQAELGSPDRR